MRGICKVCDLLDKDTSIKEINYCKLCNEYLCVPCESNLLRRGKAYLINKLKK